MKFKVVERTPTTQTPIANKVIDTTQIRGIQLGVFHNADRYTAMMTYKFHDLQEGWNSDSITLTNDLYERRHIQYQMPNGFEFAQPWYSRVIDRAKQFQRQTKSNLMTKLGYRFADRYHTIPYTWVCYDPNTKLCLLQQTIPTGTSEQPDFFAEHFEIEIELTNQGNRNLNYSYVEPE